ncbi:MAG: hypothetical protein JWQ11_4772, partial [Rhizobacter sp.]|nr:hypothetical protein [Rhizobacter sp.]
MTSSPKYTLQLINQKGAVEQTVQIDPSASPAQKLAPLRGQTGMRFNLFDDTALIGPQRFIARRDGYDLQLFLDANTVNMFNAATAQPDVV